MRTIAEVHCTFVQPSKIAERRSNSDQPRGRVHDRHSPAGKSSARFSAKKAAAGSPRAGEAWKIALHNRAAARAVRARVGRRRVHTSPLTPANSHAPPDGHYLPLLRRSFINFPITPLRLAPPQHLQRQGHQVAVPRYPCP